MCLIFTAAAAAVSGILYFVSNKRRGQGYKSLATAALICTAAALMWCVDGFAAIAAGEPFFDLSIDNAVLGVIVVAAAVAVFAVLFFFEKRNEKRNHRSSARKISSEQ